MPSSESGASRAHGMLRISTQISPFACGGSVTAPPGVCPCTTTPFTLRFTTTALSVVLLTATETRPYFERSHSPPAKSMRTPGQRYSVPVLTPIDPSGSGSMTESGCAWSAVAADGHSTTASDAAAHATGNADAKMHASLCNELITLHIITNPYPPKANKTNNLRRI